MLTRRPSSGGHLEGQKEERGLVLSDDLRTKLPFTHSEGGGLVLAHTTDLRRPFLCQPCPALQLLSASEIPRERRIIVGLSPLNLSRETEKTKGGSEAAKQSFLPAFLAHIAWCACT